jgi:hypothetical protein
MRSAGHCSNLFIVLFGLRVGLAFSHAASVVITFFRSFWWIIFPSIFRILFSFGRRFLRISHWWKVWSCHGSQGWKIHEVTHSVGERRTSRKASSCNTAAVRASFPIFSEFCLVSRELRSVNVLERLVLTLNLAEFSLR